MIFSRPLYIISKYQYKYPRYIFLLDIVAADDFRYKFHNRYFQGFHKRASKDNELKEREKEKKWCSKTDTDRMFFWLTGDIPHICQFWYTTVLCRLDGLHQKVHKFATRSLKLAVSMLKHEEKYTTAVLTNMS